MLIHSRKKNLDLDAVKAQIKTLDSETKAAIDKAESFMRQLGL